MKGTLSTFLSRAMIVSAFMASTIAWTSSGASALTSHTTAVQSTCNIVLNPSVRLESKIPCIVQFRVTGSARLNLSTGFRWGVPTSTSNVVTVTSISRNSVGVYSAVLHATKIGRATIHVTGTEACTPGLMCPDLAILWTLQVVVTKTI